MFLLSSIGQAYKKIKSPLASYLSNSLSQNDDSFQEPHEDLSRE